MKISFIGGGNMGEAILAAIINKKVSKSRSICVSDVSESRRRHLEQKYGIAVTDDNLKAVANCDVIILAIKPQNLPEVMAGLSGSLNPKQLVLSIIAGAAIKTLRRGLRHRRIARAMPNTPALIGEGIAVWTATAQVAGRQKKQAGRILGATGEEFYVEDEKYLDMATAISGSGPAYFFLFVESLVDAAIRIGMPGDSAERLLLQTMLGSAHLLRQSGKSPAELRKSVTSPGGTTAAAISRFETGNLSQLVEQAVTAAYKRAKELGS